ncbi:hypothetical protein K7432_010682 [Basidiobolus ranarum]|uniref:Intimal thickness related receptor IRP domain-containing protein n=1 Tax=Basidiobolus ranarum TaxID=34480 RepID=A0ABR2VV51_9FUNG
MRVIHCMLFTWYLLFVLPLVSYAYFTLEYPIQLSKDIYPSHDFYGFFEKHHDTINYDYTAVVIRLNFDKNDKCLFHVSLPTLDLSEETLNKLDGYVVFVSSEDITQHRCNGMAEILNKLDITESYNRTLFNDNQDRPFLLSLFSSTLNSLEFGGPFEYYGKLNHLDTNNRTVITDFYSGQRLYQLTQNGETPVIQIFHEYGPWNASTISYTIALDRRTLFVMIFFSLVYASCQIINLFYQEGWVIDTRIILYVSSITWFIGSLLRLSTSDVIIPFDVVYHVMKLIAFSGYGFVQLKWGQILAKLFKRRIYRISIYWGIFAICNNVIMLVLLIIRALRPYLDSKGYIVDIYSFYIPILFLGQSYFFLYYGKYIVSPSVDLLFSNPALTALQFYRGMKTFCLSSRTKSSFKKVRKLSDELRNPTISSTNHSDLCYSAFYAMFLSWDWVYGTSSRLIGSRHPPSILYSGKYDNGYVSYLIWNYLL